MELLFSKFSAAALRRSLPKRFVQLWRVGVAAIGILGSLASSLFRLLAVSAVTAKPGNALKDSFNGGELNYRTGKLV